MPDFTMPAGTILAVAHYDDHVAWVMTKEFEAEVAAAVVRDIADPDIVDAMRQARRGARLAQ